MNIVNWVFIYLFINMLIVLGWLSYREEEVIDSVLSVLFLPLWFTLYLINNFLTFTVFKIKAYMIFGFDKKNKPKTSAQKVILGKQKEYYPYRKNTFEKVKGIFKVVTENEKKEYRRIVEEEKGNYYRYWKAGKFPAFFLFLIFVT